jgi:hypothetical protein
MTVIEHVYTDIVKDRQLNQKLKRIRKCKPSAHTFVVTYPLSQYGLLEIYDFNELLQPYYKKQLEQLVIIGVSSSRSGAYGIVTDVLQETYTFTNGFDIRGYEELRRMK